MRSFFENSDKEPAAKLGPISLVPNFLLVKVTGLVTRVALAF
jgi:hypothetical protein